MTIRRLLVLTTLLLLPLGCGGDDTASPDMATACVHNTCMCGASDPTACVGGSTVFPYESRCLPKCKISSDCAAGERCAVYFDDVGVRTCTGDDTPPACAGAGAPTCTLTDAYCFSDGMTLVRPFKTANRCGYEFLGCASGCSATGGAHCN